MDMRNNLVKGLDDSELQIIGLEFTVRLPDGNRQELAMFSPVGLIIPRMVSAPNRAGWGGYGYEPAVTFHSTIGDFTLTGYNCPW